MRWFNWDKMCKHKKEGGMGFRKLHDFNMAMVAKQGWQILKFLTCLMAHVLKARYFRVGSFLEAKVGENPSFIWRSVWQASSVIKQGYRWRIGNGQSVKV